MATGASSPFRPTGTVSITTTTTSNAAPLNGGGESVVVTNTSGSLIYVRFGADPTVVAATFDMPVLPNSRVMLAVNSLISHVASVASSGSGAVLFTRGDGNFV